jgi:hypothetical protein
MRLPWPNCSAAREGRLATRRTGVCAPVHGRPGRDAGINQAVAGLLDHPVTPDAFARGSYRRLRVGSYRVLYEVEADVVTIVRVDKVP